MGLPQNGRVGAPGVQHLRAALDEGPGGSGARRTTSTSSIRLDDLLVELVVVLLALSMSTARRGRASADLHHLEAVQARHLDVEDDGVQGSATTCPCSCSAPEHHDQARRGDHRARSPTRCWWSASPGSAAGHSSSAARRWTPALATRSAAAPTGAWPGPALRRQGRDLADDGRGVVLPVGSMPPPARRSSAPSPPRTAPVIYASRSPAVSRWRGRDLVSGALDGAVVPRPGARHAAHGAGACAALARRWRARDAVIWCPEESGAARPGGDEIGGHCCRWSTKNSVRCAGWRSTWSSTAPTAGQAHAGGPGRRRPASPSARRKRGPVGLLGGRRREPDVRALGPKCVRRTGMRRWPRPTGRSALHPPMSAAWPARAWCGAARWPRHPWPRRGDFL